MTNTQPANAPVETISEKALWAIFVSSEIPLMTDHGITADTVRPDDLLRDPGAYMMPECSDDIADAIGGAEDPDETVNAMIEDYGNYLRNLTAIRNTFAIMKSQQFVYSDGVDVLYRKPEGEAA